MLPYPQMLVGTATCSVGGRRLTALMSVHLGFCVSTFRIWADFLPASLAHSQLLLSVLGGEAGCEDGPSRTLE